MKKIGILDPDGKNPNPLNGKPYSKRYLELSKMWRNLAAYKTAESTIADIKSHQVILITSATGSGKTVFIPKFLLHAIGYDKKIAVTQPKQLLCLDNSSYAAETLDVELGKEVGYKFKGSPKDGRSKDTKLLYATDGTIVARILNDSNLSEFDGIIVDEVHERKVQIDFLLYLLREVIKKRPEFKVILMSATINLDIFKSYFKAFKLKHLHLSGSTTYPIKYIYLDKKTNYRKSLDKSLDIVLDIIRTDDPTTKGSHDILFFVTTAQEAFSLCRRIGDHLRKNGISHKGGRMTETEDKINSKNNVLMYQQGGSLYCVELFSESGTDKQLLATDATLYKKLGNGKYNRKIIIATEVAESSITFKGLKYVIDGGHSFVSSYDPEYKAKVLLRKLISCDQADQRGGRVGRTEEGICYRLYTKEQYDEEMEKYRQPDIRSSDITNECLKLFSTNIITNTKELLNVLTNFIEPPPEKYIRSSIENLNQLKLIEDNRLTELGITISLLGMEPMEGLALAMSLVYECSHEMVDLISYINTSSMNLKKIFIMPENMVKDRRNKELLEEMTTKFHVSRKQFHHKYGDHLSLLNIYNAFAELQRNNESNESISVWCNTNFLNYSKLSKARNYAMRTQSQMRKILDSTKTMEKDENIMKLGLDERLLICLGKSYNPNIAKMKGNNWSTSSSGDLDIKLDENSFLHYNKDSINTLVYGELFIGPGGNALNIVSQIPKELLKYI